MTEKLLPSWIADQVKQVDQAGAAWRKMQKSQTSSMGIEFPSPGTEVFAVIEGRSTTRKLKGQQVTSRKKVLALRDGESQEPSYIPTRTTPSWIPRVRIDDVRHIPYLQQDRWAIDNALQRADPILKPARPREATTTNCR